MKRNYSLDLLRVFLCLCIIITHSISFFGISNNNVNSIILTFLSQANAIFFILSGYFNLEKEFKNKADIIKFYKNKFITIALPFLVFVFILGVWDYIRVNSSFNILDYLGIYYSAIMDTSAGGHMWFLYTLFGLLLSTPFLSKALHHMDEKELTLLWYIGLGWNFASIYLCSNFGINFRFTAWMFDDWMLYYFAGYYYRHVVVNQSKTKWAILGIGGFVLTNIGVLFIDNFTAATTSQVLFTLFCMGCLMFWDKGINIKSERIKNIISYLGRHTFLIYLFNFRVIDFVQRKLAITNGSVLNGLAVVIISFIGSLVLSIITGICLKPVQRLIDKIWVIKENN